MIKRLKRKYVIIVMTAVIAVLGVMVSAINALSYSAVNSQLDDKLKMLVENEGLMPDFSISADTEDEENAENTEDGGDTESGGEDTGAEDTDIEPGTDDPEGTDGTEGSSSGNDTDGDSADVKNDKEDEEDPREHMSPETPFETRYFSVKFNTDGTVSAIDTTKIAAVDVTRAEEYARDIVAAGKSVGYVDTYKYRMGSTEDGGTIYVFLDANRELESIRSFLLSSIFISVIGIMVIFVMVILLSGYALKPMIESYEKQKRFITDAGHEMKTPLTVISANTEVIEMESGESQWTEGIKSQVSKLASLTEKLVILSKMEEGIKLEMKEFSLSEALYDTCEQYKSIAMSKGIRIDLAISENVQMIGNEGEMRRCITLMLDNAFRYANEGGFVSVRAQKLPNGVEMRFSNSTEGVEKGSLDRWFDRFYRTDLSRNSDTGGSGIGLSVVKAIVLAHGGNVHAHSNDGMTVEFVISI